MGQQGKSFCKINNVARAVKPKNTGQAIANTKIESASKRAK